MKKAKTEHEFGKQRDAEEKEGGRKDEGKEKREG